MKIERKYLKRMAELLEPPAVSYVPMATSAYALISEISRFLRDYFRGAYEEERQLNSDLSIIVSLDAVALFFRQNFYAVMGGQMIDFRVKLIGGGLYFGLFYDTSCLTEDDISQMKENAKRAFFDIEFCPDCVVIRIKGTPYLHFGAKSTNFVYQRFVSFFSPNGRFTKPEDD